MSDYSSEPAFLWTQVLAARDRDVAIAASQRRPSFWEIFRAIRASVKGP